MSTDDGITVDQMIDATEGLPSDRLLGQVMAALQYGRQLDAAGFLRECDHLRAKTATT